MTLRIIGAGHGRTGTASLKIAIERLLGGPCYHMKEVFRHPDHVPIWHEAARGNLPAWESFLGGFVGAVDEPPAAFWRQLAEAFPDALILLSTRDAEDWWDSVDQTAFRVLRSDPPNDPPFMRAWHAMVVDVFESQFPGMLHDRERALGQFNAHNEAVRRDVPVDRLIDWRLGDGWAPICRALEMPVPDEPFPHANTRAEFIARLDEWEAS